MHTEEEAKMKICPTARNKGTDDLCAGAKCMAWRWGDIELDGGTGQVSIVTQSTTHGYCGMAGKP